MTPQVTCIIPTHGRPEALRESLTSVRAQTQAPVAVVVVDDVDDPFTADLVSEFEDSAPFSVIRVVNRDQGASSSRNLGARNAATDLIAFLDDDDSWDTEYLEQATRRLLTTEADAVITPLRRRRNTGIAQVMVMPDEVAPGQLFDKNPGMTGSNVVLKKAAFCKVNGFDAGLPVMNDWDFIARFLQEGLTYVVADDAFAEWREHDGDRISSPSNRRAAGIEKFVNKHSDAMNDKQRKDLLAQAIGIRRRNATSRWEKGTQTARLARLLGPRETVRRQVIDIRKSSVSGRR